ncbi:hypothetical protein PIB30_054963 [Stylosanthes scabra]|uniref:Uncharacterized protein n=1 Tax=Stylosanthes scabra TaxID=79078 RepID=A0ABU6SJ52_9FABA|nr:hypothetical protein [Stylosanthes scabra]
MEPQRTTKRRNPLSDCTNTLNSSSSSSLPINPIKPKPKPKPPSSTSKPRSNKPSSRASSTNASTNLESASSNPTVAPPPPPPPPSSPKPSSPPVTYSRRSAPSKSKRKEKGKALAFPDISTPILKLSDTRHKIDGGESVNLTKAKALTVPLRKKQRTMPSEDAFKDSELQDYIEKQKAYFKMIDEFELEEEEVETVDEQDKGDKT